MPGYITRQELGGLFAYADQTTGSVDRPASRDRAQREANDGTAADRALQILNILTHEPRGLTWGEVADRLGLHHGQASGALSNLHKTGRVFMLRTKRGKAHPYCHAHFRDAYPDGERFDTPAQTHAGKTRELERTIIAALEANHRRGLHHPDPYIESLIRALGTLKGDN